MKQYESFELTYKGREPEGSLVSVDLSADFCIGEKHCVIPGFYAGRGTYKIRFLPLQAGHYSWKVSGLFSDQGEADCEMHAPAHHGPVRVRDTHFEFEDGSRYIPFGTTVYALVSQTDDLVTRTLQSLRNAPFNKVRICVFPKHYEYNGNEPPLFAFEKAEDGSWDTDRPCFAFWDRLERILGDISALDIQTDLILFHPYDRWGFSRMSRQDNLRYLDYLLRRLASRPDIWWSLANEYDLLMENKSLADWQEIGIFVSRRDPCGHLLSVHNFLCPWNAADEIVSHASLQTKALTEIPRWIRQYNKPVIVDECGYEGDLPENWGNLSGREMTSRFWRCYLSGGFCTHGETYYSEDEVLWWSQGGCLKGESPARIAFLKKILYELPGPLTPVPDSNFELSQILPESLETVLGTLPQEMRGTVRIMAESFYRMNRPDREMYFASEHIWYACCREDAYLWFNDLHCCRSMTLALPENRTYRVELIDTWEMKRSILKDCACGQTQISLPAKEGLAVLALRDTCLI